MRFSDYFSRIEVKIMIDFSLIYFAVGKLNLLKKGNLLLILEIGKNWGEFEEKLCSTAYRTVTIIERLLNQQPATTFCIFISIQMLFRYRLFCLPQYPLFLFVNKPVTFPLYIIAICCLFFSLKTVRSMLPKLVCFKVSNYDAISVFYSIFINVKRFQSNY